MTVDEVYSLIDYIANKNQQGYISPDDFHNIINQAQRSYAAFLLGRFQQYAPGRPIANVELGQNSIVRQRLAPIIYGYNLNINSDGFSGYPSDYIQTDAMWSIYGYQRIRYADQHKFSSIYNSVIDPIRTNPIYVLEDTGFRFFPTTTANAKLHYVKDPPNIVWGYTLDSNGTPVYDSAGSVQPVWDDIAIFEIIARALQMVGINLQSNAIVQYANEIKTTGQ